LIFAEIQDLEKSKCKNLLNWTLSQLSMESKWNKKRKRNTWNCEFACRFMPWSSVWLYLRFLSSPIRTINCFKKPHTIASGEATLHNALIRQTLVIMCRVSERFVL